MTQTNHPIPPHQPPPVEPASGQPGQRTAHQDSAHPHQDVLARCLDELMGDRERDTDTRAFLAREAAEAVIAIGWRPPAQVITDPAELDALPDRSVVVAPRSGMAWQREFGDKWLGDGGVQLYSDDLLANYGPAVTLVHTPTVIGVTE